MNIFLCGYMGVGKSTVGKSLAEMKNMSFIDLDEYLEKQLAMSISDIFSTKGEDFFREEEYQACIDLLTNDNAIIALGGGTLEYPNLAQRIRKKALLIYLEASPEFLSERLQSNAQTRPLIAGLIDEERLNFIKDHLSSRNENYQKAQLKLNVENKSADEIANTLNAYLDLF